MTQSKAMTHGYSMTLDRSMTVGTSPPGSGAGARQAHVEPEKHGARPKHDAQVMDER